MRKLPDIITQEEFEVLFDAASKLEKKKKTKRAKHQIKKYRIAMLLGFEAGMRISEVVGYGEKVPALTKDRVDDVSIKIISGKGGKDRVVPKPKRLNKTATEMLPLNLKRRSLQHFITSLGKDTLNKKISFHTLRHAFCSHLAGQGRPLHEIQMLAGHSRLDTTGIYLHVNPKKAIEKAREVF